MTYKTQADCAAAIRARRKELMLTQRHLANRLGVSGTFIAEVETRKAPVPYDRARRFAVALEMDELWFAKRLIQERLPELAKAIFPSKTDAE